MASDPSDDLFDPYELNEPADDLDALADAAAQGVEAGQRPLPRGSYPQDAEGRIATDLPCIHCDYNLRGQLPTGVCPECGAPVSASMRSDRLSESNPQWLGQIKQGANWLFGAGIGMFLLACTAGGITAAANPSDPAATSIIETAFSAVQALLFGVGYWLITTPEPGVMRPRISRPITRWTAVPGYVLSPIASLVAISQSPPLLFAAAGLELIGGLGVTVGFLACLIYLRHLARRIPDRGLAKHTTIVFWGWIISITALVAGVVTAIILFAVQASSASGPNPSSFARVLGLAGIFVCPCLIALLTFYIWWIVIMHSYGQCFGRAAHASRLRQHPQPEQDVIEPDAW